MALMQDISAYIFCLLICDHHCLWLPTLLYVCPYTFTSTASSPLGISLLFLGSPLWVTRFGEDLLSVFLLDEVVFLWLPWTFVAVRGLSAAVVCKGSCLTGVRASQCSGFSCCRAQAPAVAHSGSVGVLCTLGCTASRDLIGCAPGL